jgi:plasmid stabilization system protein ParE
LKCLPVRWTAQASGDLIEILEFIGADRPAAAREVGRDVLRQSRTLARNPLRGRMMPELSEQGIKDYRQILVSRYRVIYRVRSDAVEVAAVIDTARDLGEALLRRLLR